MSISDPSARPGLVALLGAKGGVGTTTIAANLAAVTTGSATTILADLDFCKGDVATYLNMDAPPLLATLLDAGRAPDADALHTATLRHDAGFHALLQPGDLTALRQVSRETTLNLVRAMRSAWQVVLADLGSRVDIPALTTALAADAIVLVTTNAIPSLRDAQRILSLFVELEVPEHRIHIVVNQYDRGRVSLEECAEHLGRPIALAIPRDDDAVRQSELHGGLLVAEDKHRAARAMKRLWPHLCGEPEPVTRSIWPWARDEVIS
jgi:pilus assembly protein CpaE